MPKGIPQFWLNVLRNREELAEHVRAVSSPLPWKLLDFHSCNGDQRSPILTFAGV